jgi:protein-tyrosine phosphatase
MIDFHTHILPGMDDGSSSIQESIALLDAEREQGIETVILTPHYHPGKETPAQFVQRRQDAMNKLGAWASMNPVRLYAGAEVEYFDGICQAEDLELLTIEGTNLFLLEMPYCAWTERMVRDVLEISSLRSITVVLAHIERYLDLQPVTTLDCLLKNGILFQANASFFLNWKSRRRARKMLQNGQIHFVGSDCHNTDRRPPNMGKIAQYIKSHEDVLRSNFSPLK